MAIKERLMKLSDNDRRVESQIIVRELTKLLGDTPLTVGVYLPYIDEPDIKPLLSDLLKRGFHLCLPKADPHKMMMYPIHSLTDIQKNSITGIPEPLSFASPIDEKTIDVVLVPGRAFTDKCVRLGRGSGGYDHWIEDQRKRNSETKYIGLCFDCQLVQAVPTASHDQLMDIVVTPSKIFRRGS